MASGTSGGYLLLLAFICQGLGCSCQAQANTSAPSENTTSASARNHSSFIFDTVTYPVTDGGSSPLISGIGVGILDSLADTPTDATLLELTSFTRRQQRITENYMLAFVFYAISLTVLFILCVMLLVWLIITREAMNVALKEWAPDLYNSTFLNLKLFVNLTLGQIADSRKRQLPFHNVSRVLGPDFDRTFEKFIASSVMEDARVPLHHMARDCATDHRYLGRVLNAAGHHRLGVTFRKIGDQCARVHRDNEELFGNVVEAVARTTAPYRLKLLEILADSMSTLDASDVDVSPSYTSIDMLQMKLQGLQGVLQKFTLRQRSPIVNDSLSSHEDLFQRLLLSIRNTSMHPAICSGASSHGPLHRISSLTAIHSTEHTHDHLVTPVRHAHSCTTVETLLPPPPQRVIIATPPLLPPAPIMMPPPMIIQPPPPPQANEAWLPAQGDSLARDIRDTNVFRRLEAIHTLASTPTVYNCNGLRQTENQQAATAHTTINFYGSSAPSGYGLMPQAQPMYAMPSSPGTTSVRRVTSLSQLYSSTVATAPAYPQYQYAYPAAAPVSQRTVSFRRVGSTSQPCQVNTQIPATTTVQYAEYPTVTQTPQGATTCDEQERRSRRLQYVYPTVSEVPQGKASVTRATTQQVSVKKKVKATERDRWLEGMQTKKALEGYRLNKTVIAKESIYYNSRGSSLLFEARTGVLRTRTYRAKYQEMDTVCAACGEEDETAEHLILYCKGLHPMHTEDNIDLIRSLGFRDSEGKVDFKTVEITKQRLSEWWQKAREN
ncbi:hypothetical protein HPB47_001809 [Ixodes persulcatus]|uniref:Uncharacterized protein n=1 Tax=Ixodes persulcatus TaxID=34615 RepID=A0AC60PPT5_IXOPE|nr:hypothetical protein HPB47_001809 [Ixodes persulcatus]